jgi:hypothetical protein
VLRPLVLVPPSGTLVEFVFSVPPVPSAVEVALESLGSGRLLSCVLEALESSEEDATAELDVPMVRASDNVVNATPRVLEIDGMGVGEVLDGDVGVGVGVGVLTAGALDN